MSRSTMLIMGSLVLAIGACGDDSSPGGGDAGHDGGGRGDGAITVDGGSHDADGSATDGAADAVTPPVDGGSDAVVPPADAGGICSPAVPCGSDQLCRYEPGCGMPAGHCMVAACTADVTPFCMCDGTTVDGSSSCPPGPYLHSGPCEGSDGGTGSPSCSGAAVCPGVLTCIGGPLCSDTWTCAALGLACTDDSVPYCGCDGATFMDSSTCPRRSFSQTGPCMSAGGVRCAGSVTCTTPPPVCPDGTVASIVGLCYGPCVPIDACECASAGDCPMPERYTCHLGAGHCGPFV